MTLCWVTSEFPVDMASAADRAQNQGRRAAARQRHHFPHRRFRADADRRLRRRRSSPDSCSTWASDPATQGYARHENTHRTRTIDYALVLEGEIDMLLDDTEVHVKAGDILGAAGHQSRLGQQLRQAVPHRLHPDRRQDAAGSGSRAGKNKSRDAASLLPRGEKDRMRGFGRSGLFLNFPTVTATLSPTGRGSPERHCEQRGEEVLSQIILPPPGADAKGTRPPASRAR